MRAGLINFMRSKNRVSAIKKKKKIFFKEPKKLSRKLKKLLKPYLLLVFILLSKFLIKRFFPSLNNKDKVNSTVKTVKKSILKHNYLLIFD